MVFYTSKELVDWIQRWAEQQGLTVSVILHRILRNSYQQAQRQQEDQHQGQDAPRKTGRIGAPSCLRRLVC